MKASIYTKYGPPEVVKITNAVKPTPKDNEVLIKIHATTVNRTDCGFRSAEYFIVRFFSGLFSPKNKILGSEFAGEIETMGKDVKSFNIGDRVFGYNDKSFGAHAEYMLMQEDDAITTMPTKLSYLESAPIIEGAHYALCDIRAAKIKNGQQVLINGATGGIGSSAVQLAKYFGAEVTAVCASHSIELVKSLGADDVIDYTKEDFTKRTKKFDVVFDAVGKSSFGNCKAILKYDGIYMSTELGYMSQNIFLALITAFFGKKKVLFPIPTINKADVNFLKNLVETGQFKPVIDRVYSLDQIVEAYKYVEAGQKIGNVVIKVID
ncbi:MAG: NAD(P)-dependent alcohol dehydrogenase [Saprospiraceae bacterium]|nr:NAD(P)-dependent alcohol dehydrogenase [Saprospiraceae bacterium]MBK9721215.1 NAD(P)-dependent alcohol dehydrogenase [Saprospiraceae bacterium]